MAMWIGLLIGVVLGAAVGGLPGAIVAGFFGWLVGVIINSNKRGESKPVEQKTPNQVSLQSRVARLEITVEQLQKRIAALDKGVIPTAESVIPAEAGIQPEAEASQPVMPVETGIQPETEVPTVEQASAPASGWVPASAGTTASAPPPPREPPKPNPIVAWFMGGNTIARVGLVILFIGLAFLLKYAADHQMFPVELRVMLVAAAGLALLIVGWRLRHKNPGYALGLQGGGVAVLYLTTFGAFRLWQLLPAEAAFFLLVAIAAFSAILAIRQDSLALAVFGVSGGFLAPILASTGGGSHVALFSYYLVLNLGILGVALYKAWRPLNLAGFLFTFFIGLAWGLKFYKPEYFESVEPFLVAFFVMYVAIAILFARSRPPELKGFVDGTIVFGVPLAAFGLQAALTKDTEFGLSFSALAMSALYLILAGILRRTKRENYALLAETFIALGVVFATVAIPLALDARWTSAAWALEGAAIVWIGVRQNRILARCFGLLLQFAAGWAYVEAYHRLSPGDTPLIDAPFVGALLVALAGLFTNRLLKRDKVHEAEKGFAPFVFAWGLLWALFAFHHEIMAFMPNTHVLNAHVALLASAAFLLGVLAMRWQWTEAGWAARLLIPVLIPFLVAAVALHRHPFDHLGWIVWPFVIAVHFWVLRKLDAPSAPRYMYALHVAGVLVIALLGARELNWLAADYTSHGTAWSIAAVAVVPALLVWIAASKSADGRWPVAGNESAYRKTAVRLIALGLIVWSLYANVTHDGRSDPLPYLPILNALDLAHVLAGLAFVAAWFAIQRSDLPMSDAATRRWMIVAGAIAFIWLNGILLRSLHHWADVPYTFDGVRHSVIAQSALSIFWAVLALTTMVFATRTARRALWMTGAVLMAVVVVKLFIVDLSRVAGISRIISFIAVGVLMLVIGYFSPVPPRQTEPPK